MNISTIDSYSAIAAVNKVNEAVDSSNAFKETLDNAVKAKDKENLKKACTEFESYFLQLTMKEMKKTVNSEKGILPKGQAEQIFQDMLDEENAKNMAKTGSLGLADMMYKQLSKDI